MLLPVFVAGLWGCSRDPVAQARKTPSGYPVPRYLSLKADEVNARSGPSQDNRVLWVYRSRYLPVLVIDETRDWRRVCDPDGQVAWIHKRGTDGVRTVLTLAGSPAPLYRQPKAGSEITAILQPRVIAMVLSEKPGWLKVKVDRQSGWLGTDKVWGAAETAECR